MVGVLKYENKPLRIRWYSFNSLYTTSFEKKKLSEVFPANFDTGFARFS